MPLRLVAIGDSTVEGVEDPGPGGVYIGLADRFAAHLDVMYPGLLYANLAVRGRTTREVRESRARSGAAPLLRRPRRSSVRSVLSGNYPELMR